MHSFSKTKLKKDILIALAVVAVSAHLACIPFFASV